MVPRVCISFVVAVAAILALTSASGAQQRVDLELVLAIDTSTSVDATEFRLQRGGLADAFRHPDVIGAIEAAGDLGIAVTVVQWSGRARQRTVVDWMHIRNGRDAAFFADRIATARRAIEGMTDIAGAVDFGVARLNDNAFAGRRQVIDISGDGSSDAARSEMARDRAVARGVTVNGLVIYNEDIDLAELAKIDVRDHYANHVIGGVGAFMMTAADFEDFRIAIRKKLVREITGPATARIRPGGYTSSRHSAWHRQ